MRSPLVLSCEHGGRDVPPAVVERFRGAEAVLRSHRGWDAGALVLARELARTFQAPLVASTTTRLAVDANRPLGHQDLFSRWTRGLPLEEREELLKRFWKPHWDEVERLVRRGAARGGTVLHVSVHSFTPHWKGRERSVDVGWLFDPTRRREVAFTTAWLEAMRDRTDLRLCRNRPYRGTGDGLTTSLRGIIGEDAYLGIELEVSQRFPLEGGAPWRRLRSQLRASLSEAMATIRS